MNTIIFDRNFLSNIFDILCKLEIGLKFAEISRSRSGLSIIIIIIISLYSNCSSSHSINLRDSKCSYFTLFILHIVFKVSVLTSRYSHCNGIFAPLIARLANIPFSQGRFPAQFKLAQVSPLLKRREWTSTIQQVSDPYPTWTLFLKLWRY